MELIMGWENGSKISKDMKFDRAVNRFSVGIIIDKRGLINWAGLLKRKLLVIKLL